MPFCVAIALLGLTRFGGHANSTDCSLKFYGASVPKSLLDTLGVVKDLDVVEEGAAELILGVPAFGVVDPGQLSF
jgi:hypothetical protein